MKFFNVLIRYLVVTLLSIAGMLGAGLYFLTGRLDLQGVANLKSTIQKHYQNPLANAPEVEDLFNEADQAAAQAGNLPPSPTIEVDGTSQAFSDPAAVEMIENMAVPDDVKQELLKNYHATGVFPRELLSDRSEERQPAAENAKPKSPAN